MAKVTIIDVARLAGVSTATVSRAMHTPHVVRPATLERVRAVMRDCGYIYNATAGDFSRRRSTVLGVLILSTTTKVATSLSAAQEVATQRQFPLIVSTSGFDPRLERKHLQQFLQRGVAGLLVIGHMKENQPRIQELQQLGIPCVYLWEVLPETQDSYVGFDNVKGPHAMMEYLIGQGYRRIGFICGFNAGVDRLAKRYDGYMAALRANGIPLDESLVRSATSTFANGKAAMRELMALPVPPRCVCCASDVLAAGAMAAVHEAGLSVPLDYCIAGFDNTQMASYLNPTLSTVDVPGVEMGRLGMEALLTLVENEDHPPIQKELPTSLIIRA
ncbi:LacI family transcriptional regulator, partial [Desulfovibrio sp. OttesenSCG-928-F20]|nr:LacI family transcriptional regulator [Desulfovibrio sp. OttesenSCG-928-F20]